MEVLTRLLAAAALLAAAGCSFMRDATPVEAMGDQPSVHSLLVTGSDTVRVLVQSVGRGINPTQEPVDARPLVGAEVRLAVGGQSVRLDGSFPGCVAPSPGAPASAETAGCYGAVIAGGVRPGATYSLAIRLPGGGTIEGRATALPALRLDSPAAGARIRLAACTYCGNFANPTQVPLALRGAEGAPAAAVELVPTVVYSGGQALTSFYCSAEYARGEALPREAAGNVTLPLFGITCIPRTAAGTARDPQFRTDSVRAVLRVVAYDSAYTRYAGVQERKSAAASMLREGLTGAIGVFAAAALAEREVVLVPGQP